jgi:single-strand DNA-binding protein
MSESYTSKGTVLVIGETQEFSSGFKKRQLVITTEADSKYPQEVGFEVIKDNCSLLDALSVGQEVTVTFNLRGNEYNGRYYVNLQCWKLEAGEGFAPSEQPNVEVVEAEDIPW